MNIQQIGSLGQNCLTALINNDLYIYDKNTFKQIDLISLENQKIVSYYKKNNTLFLGTQKGNLVYYQLNMKKVSYQFKILNQSISSIKENKNYPNELFLSGGSTQGFHSRYNHQQCAIKLVRKFKHPIIYSIFNEKQDKIIFGSTSRSNNIYIYNL